MSGLTQILDGLAPQAPTVGPDRALARRVLDHGIEAGLEEYAGLSWSVRADGFERKINGLGYQLMGQGRAGEALLLLEFNTRAFSEIANTWDSLGEAYLQAGQRQSAIESYRKALELGPRERHRPCDAREDRPRALRDSSRANGLAPGLGPRDLCAAP